MWENDTKEEEKISLGIWEQKNKTFWNGYRDQFTRDLNSRNPFIKNLSSNQTTDNDQHNKNHENTSHRYPPRRSTRATSNISQQTPSNNNDDNNSQRYTPRRPTRLTRQRNINDGTSSSQQTPSKATVSQSQPLNNRTISNTQPERSNNLNINTNEDTIQTRSQPDFLYRRYPNRQRKR